MEALVKEREAQLRWLGSFLKLVITWESDFQFSYVLSQSLVSTLLMLCSGGSVGLDSHTFDVAIHHGHQLVRKNYL